MATVSSVAADFPTRLRVVRRLILERCATVEAGRRAAGLLERLEARLQHPPRIIVLGEANSGKTTLANRLIERDLLTTDIVCNTRAPVLLRHASAPSVHIVDGEGGRHVLERGSAGRTLREKATLVEVGLPLECLKSFEILDTPGLTADEDAVVRARALCRTAHMAIWCTVASQAWRASEVALWAALGKRLGPASVLAATFAGNLDAADRDKVRGRLEREAGASFRNTVLVGAAPMDEGAEAEASTGDDVLAAVAAAVADAQTQRYRRAGEVVRHFSERLLQDARGRRATTPRPGPAEHANAGEPAEAAVR